MQKHTDLFCHSLLECNNLQIQQNIFFLNFNLQQLFYNEKEKFQTVLSNKISFRPMKMSRKFKVHILTGLS